MEKGSVISIKSKILSEAEALFLKYGFKSITMDDVARELGVSKKTLYQHFADKNDLVGQCVNGRISEMNDYCNHIMQGKENAINMMLGITEYVGALLRTMNPGSMYDLKKYFKPSWDKLEANRKQFIFNNIKTNLELGQKKGLYRKDLDNEMICKVYVHLISFITDPDNYDTLTMDMKKLHFEIIKYHLRSIVTMKGGEILEEKIKELKK